MLSGGGRDIAPPVNDGGGGGGGDDDDDDDDDGSLGLIVFAFSRNCNRNCMFSCCTLSISFFQSSTSLRLIFEAVLVVF